MRLRSLISDRWYRKGRICLVWLVGSMAEVVAGVDHHLTVEAEGARITEDHLVVAAAAATVHHIHREEEQG